MSLGKKFTASAGAKTPKSPKRKRLPPLSVRLSEAERSRLREEAKGAPLSSYIKAKALGTPPLRLRRSGLALADRQALGQVLALLGSSELLASLSQLSEAASIGALPLTPEIEADLFEAVEQVRDIRRLLIRALGMTEANQ